MRVGEPLRAVVVAVRSTCASGAQRQRQVPPVVLRPQHPARPQFLQERGVEDEKFRDRLGLQVHHEEPFPTAGSLPRFNGGSASVVRVSRPARRSLALWPVWSLSRPRRPFVIGVLQTMLLPPPSAPTASGWSDSCRAGFAPAEDWRLVTAHVEIHAKDGDGNYLATWQPREDSRKRAARAHPAIRIFSGAGWKPASSRACRIRATSARR